MPPPPFLNKGIQKPNILFLCLNPLERRPLRVGKVFLFLGRFWAKMDLALWASPADAGDWNAQTLKMLVETNCPGYVSHAMILPMMPHSRSPPLSPNCVIVPVPMIFSMAAQ